MSVARHQNKRRALGSAPVKKQKMPIRRTIRRREKLEVHERQTSEERGPGSPTKKGTNGRITYLRENSTQRSAQPQKQHEGQQTSKEDSDWTDLGYATDEDEYDVV
jgi:hypothetical protein